MINGKARMKSNSHQRHGKEMENLVCIGIDGRNNKDTLLYKKIIKANGEKTLKKLRDQNTT